MINKLLDEINKAPTFMNIEEELVYIEKLLEFETSIIAKSKEEFFEVLFRLDESHSKAGYFEVTKGHMSSFLEFASWLENLHKHEEIFIENKEDLEAFAVTFKLLPWVIYGEK